MASFTGRRTTRTAVIHLSAPPSKVFPLFEPLGEQLWAAGWKPELIYPESGVTEEGAVFTTRHPDEAQTIWTIVRFDPQRFRIVYIRVTPDSRVGEVAIRCTDNLDGTAQASVTYTFTALSEQGNAYIDEFTEEHYQTWITSWEHAINDYLRQGHTPQHHSDS